MKRSCALLLGALFLLVSCGQDPAQSRSGPGTPPSQTAGSPAKKEPAASATIVANDYSGGEYVSGVRTANGAGGLFYFLLNPESTVPFKAGSTLTFAKSGSAIVTKIDVAPQGTQNAVFVQVDKPLDPAGDGFPNPIRVE